MKKTRVGIIGYGWIARDGHTPFYSIVDDCEITAVCDVKPSALETAKKKLNLKTEACFDDYKKMIDSGLCDAVDICTPNYLHCPIALYALNAGLAVSIEKPVGMNVNEVREVQALAKKKNLPVFVCLTWRHHAAPRFMKDIVNSGDLGKIYHVYIRCFKDSALWPGRKLEWRFQKEKSGTGVLCDLGAHMIDLLNWIGAEVEGLSANYGTIVKRRQMENSDNWGDVTTDDWANILLDLKDGGSACIELSRAATTVDGFVCVEIYAENGYIKFDASDMRHITVCIGKRDIDSRGIHQLIVPGKYVADFKNVDLTFQERSFIDYVNGKKDEYTSTIDDGLKAQIIMDAAEISGREHRYVRLSEIEDSIK